MTPESDAALVTLRWMARGHAGASAGERAAWEILENFERGGSVDFLDDFVRLDAHGRCAVFQLLMDLAMGKTGLSEFR
jgi:hypothetical protein